MNDETIISEVNQGNMDIWEDIINTYKQKIFSMAYKFTDDYNEAQDLAQEIFIKIYKKIGSFNSKSSLSTWIYKVTVNTCIDYKKKKHLLFFPLNYNNQSSINPEENVIAREYNQHIHTLVKNLPNKYKVVIILYHFNEFSYKQISEILKIPVKTVETRLYRARKKLRKKLNLYSYGGELNEL